MIKNILYLDEAKLYSISSQVFEGVTEYLVKEIDSSSEKNEEQKGPVGSGRILADTLMLSERSVEKKFLHDYSLSLLEARLVELDLVQMIDSSKTEDSDSFKSFVRVSAPVNFIDAGKITSLLASFNALGEALAYTTTYPKLDAMRKEIEGVADPVIAKALQNELRSLEKKLANPSEFAKQSGMYQDPFFLKSLSKVTEFGFSDQLEIQQHLNDRIFSACLKREYLREKEEIIIRKYSRRTEKSFVVLGVVTQAQKSGNTAPEPTKEDMTMKEAITNMVNHIARVEVSLAGKAPNEVVIDPIAVYVTL